MMKHATPTDLWVFGYGSLMWRPGFDHVERMPATLNGYHRSLCILSVHHRGTLERPGLVLGLDRGGSCRGIAFRVAPEQAEATLHYVREREQVTMVYRETRHGLRLSNGERVEGVAFTGDRGHAQYARKLSHEALVERVRHGVGVSGNNPDYVRATVTALANMGIKDRTLARIVASLDSEGV
jgi:cation transport protein ChaC